MTKRSDGRRRQNPTKWQRKRDALLSAAGVTPADVHQRVTDQGYSYSWPTVQAVLAGRWNNEAIELAFCQLTNSTRAFAFPDNEPPYRPQPPAAQAIRGRP